MNNLYKHQLDIVTEDKKKCGLFIGTGGGKTLTALCLAKGNTLILAPKTQKEDKNWERENAKNNLNKNITVMSKETFRRDHATVPHYETLIIDEADQFLGVTPNIRWRKRQPIPKASQIYEAVIDYIERVKPDRIYLCTATILRNPFTVYAAGRVLGCKWDHTEWRNAFYVRLPMPGREVFAPKKDTATKERLGSLVRKLGYTGRLEDFFDVPPQTFKTIHLELTKAQKDRLKEIKIEYPDPLVQIGKRHQIENGIMTRNEYTKAERLPNEKIEKLIDLAIEFPRMIVWAKYTEQIESIVTALKKEGYNVYTLTGKTKDREQLFKTLRESPEAILVAQSQISAGWEWPECPVEVFASMSYSITDRIQSLGRVQRANNLKRNLYIDLIVKGGVDEAVAKAIENKTDFIEHIYLEQNEKKRS